jgi:unconventional prefoldin RPB5 interactor 1
MAASVQTTLEGIERRRAQLQESVEKLQRALTHWATWEAEYGLFKEEIEAVAAHDPSAPEMRAIAQGLDASLLNAKEVDELLGKGRSANQVVDLVQRRIDYVQQNGETVEKQLDAAEKQLAGVNVLLDPGVENEEGLPMMDIEEELDEDGNAVSSSVNQTGKGAAEVVEALRKAGLQKADLEKMLQGAGKGQLLEKEEEEEAEAEAEAEASPAPASAPAPTSSAPAVVEAGPVPAESSPAPPPPPKVTEPTKKSVSFADEPDVAPLHAHAALERNGYNEDFDALNFTHGSKVVELDQDENMVAAYPIIPQGESPEDAELRRQMLQYGLSEVGQVVAELDLETPHAEYSDFDDDDYEDYTEDEEEEDEYGRSTKPVIDDDYRQQMLELEKKLNARMLENVGPQSEDMTAEQVESVRLLKVQRDDKFDSTINSAKPKPKPRTTSSQPGKKGVRFADDLDISEPPAPAQAPPQPSPPPSRPAPTMSDVVERDAQPTQLPSAPAPASSAAKPGRVSRFKSARTQPAAPLPNPQPLSAAQPMPTGPAGRTLASTIVEHSASGDAPPNAPDEFDPQLIHRELQAQYHKARNKFIQQQGGFKPTEEDVASPIVEERGDGRTRKVSRFMAAKLRGEGGV